MTPGSSRRKRLPQQQDAYTVRDLEQIRVLADPLRLRILEAFSDERTTKQVAELLGEKVTRLYHHVDALEKAGLISLSRTRQNRGTVEKYFVAVARAFRADSRVFQPEEKGDERSVALTQMFSTIFDTTTVELTALVSRGPEGMSAIEEQGIVSFLEVRATKAQIEEVQSKLQEIIQSLVTETETDESSNEEQRRYRLTLAYYPLDATPSGASARERKSQREEPA